MSDQTNPPFLQWRMNPQLVSWAHKTFNSAQWKMLVQIMQEAEHPRLYFNKELNAERQLGRIEGWDLFLTTIKWAAIPHEAPQEVEATFEKPEEPEPPQPEPAAPKRK